MIWGAYPPRSINTLASLRDEFLENESDEWRSVNVEIKKYYDSLSEEQKKAYEKRLEEQKKADEEAKKAAEQAAAEAIAARKAAYSEEKSQLEFKLKTNHITEKNTIPNLLSSGRTDKTPPNGAAFRDLRIQSEDDPGEQRRSGAAPERRQRHHAVRRRR
ncbi:MAG: hypothetical protein ACLSG5_05410 [Oscillospiraceae bacterium]